MNILGIYDGSGPKAHRVLYPCYGLQQQFGAEIKLTYQIKEELFKDIDILLFNRLIAGISLETLLSYREKYGFKMVCDLDDHWLLGKDHVLHSRYEAYDISNKIAAYIKASDIVTVTHERLYKEVIELNKNCFILPNCIPKVDQFLTKKVPSELTRLFWAGGITHRKDLELLKRPLQLIKRDRCKLVIAGFVRGDPEWKEMAKIYTTDSSYNTVVFESMPVSEYYKSYAHCDISLIPLIDNEFNSHKSNLKILEAANIESPVIVSRVHPYLGFPNHLVNYVDSYTPWYYQINRLLKDSMLRREQGIELRNYCDVHYSFDKITLERKQIFDDTIQHRQTESVSPKVISLAK